MRLPDGASLVVPPGAASADGAASIAMLPAPGGSPSESWPERSVGGAYQLELAGGSPVRPLTVTLPFDPASLPAGTTADELLLAYHDDVANRWVPVPASVDVSGHTLSAQVRHLSDWALFAPDWNYWLALLKSAASLNFTDFLHAVSTFASGCSTSAGIFQVDNSTANHMIEGCLAKTSTAGTTLEIRNLRAFALDVSDPRGYLPQEPLLLDPGASVRFDVATSDASPVVVAADMGMDGLSRSVIDILLSLAPGWQQISGSSSYAAIGTAMVAGTSAVWANLQISDDLAAGHLDQAAEKTLALVTGEDYLSAFAAAAKAAGTRYGVPQLAAIDTNALSQILKVVKLGDLIITSWSFFGDYLFNAHTELRLSWTAGPPGPPTGLAARVASQPTTHCAPTDPAGTECIPVRLQWTPPPGQVAGYRISLYAALERVWGGPGTPPPCGWVALADTVVVPASATTYTAFMYGSPGYAGYTISAFNDAGASPAIPFPGSDPCVK
ncbi:MAG: hypothetical protein M0Z49_03965 [Chloroflexi bacterium]|nr:hypothetical protein [Chloroflexota bacterium]